MFNKNYVCRLLKIPIWSKLETKYYKKSCKKHENERKASTNSNSNDCIDKINYESWDQEMISYYEKLSILHSKYGSTNNNE